MYMEITRKHVSDFTRIFDILQYQKEKYPNPSALNSIVNGAITGYSIDDIIKNVNNISGFFFQKGLRKGDTIILMPVAGSPEWVMLDLAFQQIGVVVVPVHPTSTLSDIELILLETSPKVFIAPDDEHLVKFRPLAQKMTVDVESSSLEVIFKTAVKFNPTETLVSQLESIKHEIKPDDVLTIMYTSGSSGIPKGVVLSHHNIIHNIKAVLTMLPLEPHHRVISFLPFSHILERMACYSYLAFGVPLYFCQSKENFAEDFNAVRPYLCTSVPRVLEKMYDYMEEQSMQRNLLKRKLITWAMNVGKQYRDGGRVGIILAVKLFFARILVLSQWRKKLGGKMKYMVVGAASLRPEIGRMFSAGGIQVIEGYGMTEAAPLITINRYEPGLNRFGTVGMSIQGIDIKIDEPNANQEGEILVKGPNVTSGYFNRPDLNASAFTADGWFRTGDVGKFVHHRFLKITDRKKDIFKTSAGKYIAPQPLQNHFATSPFIERCLIIGFQRPYLTALIVPHFQLLENWCGQESIHWTSPQFMVHNIKVIAQYQREIDLLNKSLPNVEQIRNFVLCPEDWSIEKGEMTTTLKPIRQKLMTIYEAEINKMYA